MKIGILTFHETSNYGAAFQAYATQKAIQSLNYSPEIIDYVNSARNNKYSVKTRVFKNIKNGEFIKAIKYLAGFYFVRKRNISFKNFYDEFFILSSEHYNEKNISETRGKYDIFLIGSDQVWNYHNNGLDTNYALAFADGNNKVSYASSFGVSEYPIQVATQFKPLFSEINHVSVRENSGAILFKDITGKPAEVVVDPVFLLNKEDWIKVSKIHESEKLSGVFCYFSNKKYLDRFLSTRGDLLIEEKLLQFSSDFRISDVLNFKYKFLANTSPQKFLGFLLNSKLIITSSFHGVVFSIIFEKNFFVFLSGNKGRDSRIVDLLTKLGLTSRIVYPEHDYDFSVGDIEYDPVKKLLKKDVDRSFIFLKNAINELIV